MIMKKFSEIEYKRPAFETVKNDFLEILEKLKSADTYDAQKEFIYEINRLIMAFDTAYEIVDIRYSIDTRDKFYEAESEWMQKFEAGG